MSHREQMSWPFVMDTGHRKMLTHPHTHTHTNTHIDDQQNSRLIRNIACDMYAYCVSNNLNGSPCYGTKNSSSSSKIYDVEMNLCMHYLSLNCSKFHSSNNNRLHLLTLLSYSKTIGAHALVAVAVWFYLTYNGKQSLTTNSYYEIMMNILT